jgi:hypothetical protein
MKNLLAVLAALLVAQIAWVPAVAAPPAVPPMKGVVLEVKDVDAYTYLRLKTDNGETWAAVGKAAVKKGAEVTIDNPMVMRNFKSETLNRTFDTIVFGSLAGSTAAGAANLNQVHAGIATAPDAGVVKVAKAEGANARTVAEVNADRLALKDKAVVIRAKVVKFTGGIMGKNWIHLRDGSGTAADGSNDILVTSMDEPKVGDVVVAKGVVKTDVNLGSGYAYKVLVEDVSFRK